MPPFGALVVNLISRTPTLLLVSLLCIGQFIWTIAHERVTGFALFGALAGVLAVNLLFHLLYRWGREEPAFKELQLEQSGTHTIELASEESAG